MRQNRQDQLPITPLWPDHQLSEQLKVISKILDDNPSISDLIFQDLSDNVDQMNGSSGLTGDQVLRCALIKQMHQFSYAKLAFHLADSQSFRVFCRLPFGWTPAKSTLQENISRIRAATWRQVNDLLVKDACRRKLEKGRKIRVDSTAVETNIGHPTDSQLLYDGVRKVTELLEKLGRQQVFFHDHRRRAKRRCTNIRNSRAENRKRYYKDLIKVAKKTAGYGTDALHQPVPTNEPAAIAIYARLQHYLDLLEKIIDQTERRIVKGEKVPADQKVVSLFEVHTDIIQKGGRETIFGHKIFLSTGSSSLILDCRVESGNPADTRFVLPFITRHRQLFGQAPTQASFDGGFASPDNLARAKAEGLQDVVFAKKSSLKVANMARSNWVYKQLRRFRAGIEACISTLKRVFGLSRCLWKGWPHFQQYVHLSVVTNNLVVLSRLLLKR